MRPYGDGAVAGHEHRVYALIDPAAEDVHARRFGLVDDGMRGFDYRLQVVLGHTMASPGNEIRFFVIRGLL
ncbi:hypothetical protein [Arthrobacter sp. UYEF13]|uniref:hypothetical protein n=1 Tax=unclassified Pseudarthrobacter TaxID=2647000 RepID=UPI003397EB9A